MSATKYDRFKFGAHLHEFCKEVSIIGASKVVNGDLSLWRRAMWLLLLLSGLGVSYWLVGQSISYYMEDPIAVNVNVIKSKKIGFPALTVCTEMLMGRGWLQAEGKMESFREFMTRSINFQQAKCYMDIACRKKLTNIKNPLSTQDIEAIQDYMAQELLQHKKCRIAGGLCPRQGMESRFTDRFGCITIGGMMNSSNERLYTTAAGSYYGTTLQLSADLHDITYSLGYRGFRLQIHEPKANPYAMSENSILISAGEQTAISMKLKHLILLPNIQGQEQCISNKTYSKSACLADCQWREMVKTCGCVVPGLGGEPLCNDSFGYNCNVGNMLHKTTENECECPEQCETDSYDLVVSSNKLEERQQQGGNSTRISAEVLVYFSGMECQETRQQRSYDIWNLLSDIGGALGLFLGSAIFTAVEFAEFVVTACLGNARKVVVNSSM